MDSAKTTKTPKIIQVNLSTSAGRLLVDCVEGLRENKVIDEITKSSLLTVRNDVETALNLRGSGEDKRPKASAVFQLTQLSYSLLLGVIELANEVDPENPDKDFRRTLLKTLRDANPATRSATPSRAESGGGPGFD